MKAVILAAGLGTRLEPLTLRMSKGMLPVANKPLLHWIASRFDDMVIVARKEQKDILDYFSGKEIVIQKEPKGTADALLACKDVIDGNFIVVNGDDMFSEDDVKNVMKSKNSAIAVAKSGHPEKFGTVETDGKVLRINEKQVGKSSILKEQSSLESQRSSTSLQIVNCGLYKFGREIFRYLEKTPLSERGEYEITDSINLAIKGGMHFDAIEVNGWQTVSYPWDMLDASKKILEETGSIISESARILPGAFMEEPVAIGDNAVIGPNCCIRKYSSIGAGCKVGNAVEIKNSIIMEGSHVAHLSYVGDSIIGRNCNVGAGTVFANLRLDDKGIKMNVKNDRLDSGRRKLGSIVGDEVKIGVNVAMMPGRRIWPGIMIPPCALIKEDVKEQPSLRL